MAKRQTHYLEVVAPQGMQVRLLSRAQTGGEPKRGRGKEFSPWRIIQTEGFEGGAKRRLVLVPPKAGRTPVPRTRL